MTEQDFLASYDPAEFSPVAVAVDVVVLTSRGSDLNIVLTKRDAHPAKGKFALPGTFLAAHEVLAQAAQRALKQKVGLDAQARQFQIFDAVDRDPRMRILSVGHIALVPYGQLEPLLGPTRSLASVDDGIRESSGRKVRLPFDHDRIVSCAVRTLRQAADHNPFAFALLPKLFSLRELQAAREAIRGARLNKTAFRRHILDSGVLEPSGERETDKGFRPAELYRVRTVTGSAS